MKENSIATIQDRSKKIQNMTQFSASTQRDLFFNEFERAKALTISMEGTAKSLEITYTFQTDSDAVTGEVEEIVLTWVDSQAYQLFYLI